MRAGVLREGGLAPPLSGQSLRGPDITRTSLGVTLYLKFKAVGLLRYEPVFHPDLHRSVGQVTVNLPDKGFRYLRTVIVTAAVYRGFGSGLLPGYPGFIPPLNLPALGRRQSPYIDLSSLRRPVFLVNSRHRLFTATLFGSRREVLHLLRAPLLPKLRGQFAEFLGRGSPARLRILSPPTCVGLGTVRCQPPIEALSWQCGISQFTLPRQGSPSALGSEPHRLQCLDLPDTLPTTLDPDDHRRAGLPSCVTP